jgi:hypothetical protein
MEGTEEDMSAYPNIKSYLVWKLEEKKLHSDTVLIVIYFMLRNAPNRNIHGCEYGQL